MSKDTNDLLDPNDDGRITRSEIHAAVKKKGESFVLVTLNVTGGYRALTEGARRYLDTHMSSWGEKLNSAINAVKEWVLDFVWGLVKSLYRAIYFIPIFLVAVVGSVFYGTDLELKDTVSGFPGLGDLPIFAANILVRAGQRVGWPILQTVRKINAGIVSTILQETGPLAVFFLAAIQILEIGILLYLLWAGATMASSIPGVATLVAATRVVLKPFTKAYEAVRT